MYQVLHLRLLFSLYFNVYGYRDRAVKGNEHSIGTEPSLCYLPIPPQPHRITDDQPGSPLPSKVQRPCWGVPGVFVARGHTSFHCVAELACALQRGGASRSDNHRVTTRVCGGGRHLRLEPQCHLLGKAKAGFSAAGGVKHE